MQPASGSALDVQTAVQSGRCKTNARLPGRTRCSDPDFVAGDVDTGLHRAQADTSIAVRQRPRRPSVGGG